jgi:predicted nucleic acid-binding protein
VAVYFFGSSAIVKRYVNELGTAWVTSLVDPAAGNRNHSVSLTGVEVVSAITRRARGGSVATAVAAAACLQFRADFAGRYLVEQVTPGLVARAMSMAEKHALRGSDAVQLAAALQSHVQYQALGQSMTLVSADAELNAAANTEALTVEDPNNHP